MVQLQMLINFSCVCVPDKNILQVVKMLVQMKHEELSYFLRNDMRQIHLKLEVKPVSKTV